MIEEILVKYLSSKLGILVVCEEPDRPPKTYVLCEKTGGKESTGLKRSTIAIQSYGETLHAAMKLNEKVKKHMLAIVSLNEIASSRLNSDYIFTDVETKRYRYQAVFELAHY